MPFGAGIERFIAQPVDLSYGNMGGAQRRLRADDDLFQLWIEFHHIKRFAPADAQAPALADCVVDDTFVRSQNRAVQMHDIAGVSGTRAQLFDHGGIRAVGHKTDVLAIGLVGHWQTELAGKFAGFSLGFQVAQRKAQVIELFRDFANAGKIVLISSQILHEVDLISDRVVLLNSGYLVAEGDLTNIQSETGEPMKIFVRSSHANAIAAQAFEMDHVVEVQLHYDGEGLFIRSTNADAFFLNFNEQVVQRGWTIESMGPADETVEAVYQHLIVETQVAT